jgi:hypothetical protein
MEEFEPGKTISFRLPSDTPPHVSKYLSGRKKILGRKFSSEIAPIFVDAIAKKALETENVDQINILLPQGLTQEQKDWLNQPNTKALISQLLYQVVTRPTVGFDFNQQIVKEEEEESNPSPFKVNRTLQNFAQKTFLNFDDDDD